MRRRGPTIRANPLKRSGIRIKKRKVCHSTASCHALDIVDHSASDGGNFGLPVYKLRSDPMRNDEIDKLLAEAWCYWSALSSGIRRVDAEAAA